MGIEFVIPMMAISTIFIVLPGMVLHYITLWRRQKTLQPDDERMMEDLWRTAKSMERRLETLERLLEDESGSVSIPPRTSHPRT